MKLNKGLIGLALALTMAFSIASLLQRQRDDQTAFQATMQTAAAQKLTIRAFYCILKSPSAQHNLFAYLAAVNFQGALQEKAPLPDNSTRTEIYNFISANPGVQFRAICGGLGLSIGVVQFHLAQLQKSGLITSFRKGRYKRFFVAGRFSRKEMETIATLRLNTVRTILKALLEGKAVSHHQLAVRVSISSQGLTWQMNRLRETGIIQENRNGLNVTYALEATYIPMLTAAITLIELK